MAAPDLSKSSAAGVQTVPITRLQSMVLKMQHLSNKGFHSQRIYAPAEKYSMSAPFEVGRGPCQPHGSRPVWTQGWHIKAADRFTQVLASWWKVYPKLLPVSSNKPETNNKNRSLHKRNKRHCCQQWHDCSSGHFKGSYDGYLHYIHIFRLAKLHSSMSSFAIQPAL